MRKESTEYTYRNNFLSATSNLAIWLHQSPPNGDFQRSPREIHMTKLICDSKLRTR